jgi:hypothetical protein
MNLPAVLAPRVINVSVQGTGDVWRTPHTDIAETQTEGGGKEAGRRREGGGKEAAGGQTLDRRTQGSGATRTSAEAAE